jgi:hypothetical protein
MVRRPLRPTFSMSDRDVLLQAMGAARDLSGLYGGSIGYNSPQHRLTDDLHRAINVLATELTDDPTFYHATPHGRRV